MHPTTILYSVHIHEFRYACNIVYITFGKVDGYVVGPSTTTVRNTSVTRRGQPMLMLELGR